MCEVFRVSRSGFYAWRKRRMSAQRQRKQTIVKKIKRIHIESRQLYGSPKITKMLQQEGIPISQKTVARWMKEEGIRSKTKKKHKPASSSPHQLPTYPNLLEQQFHAEKPNQIWVADITYIWTARDGFILPASWICFPEELSDGPSVNE